MKRIIASFLLLTGLIGLWQVSSYAAAVNPKDRGVNFVGKDFIGVKKYALRAATQTPVKIVDGASGMLYSICRQSPTYGDYAVAFDYEVPGAGTVLDYLVSTTNRNHMEYLLSPYVYSPVYSVTVGDYVGYAEAVRGCWDPKGGPVRFENGLIGIQQGGEGYSLFYYRLDTGTNP